MGQVFDWDVIKKDADGDIISAFGIPITKKK